MKNIHCPQYLEQGSAKIKMGGEMKLFWQKIMGLESNGEDRAPLHESGKGCTLVPQKPFKKRCYARILEADLSSLFNAKEIIVKIKTFNSTFTEHLLDLGEGGLAVSLPALLSENLPVRVEFSLGKKKIIASADVRQARIVGTRYITGMNFVELARKSAEYIDGSICIHALLNEMTAEVLAEVPIYEEGRNVWFAGKRDCQNI